MQYILTEEEYKALGPKSRIQQLEQQLQKACSLLANKSEFTSCLAVEWNDGYCFHCIAYKEKLCEYPYKRLPK